MDIICPGSHTPVDHECGRNFCSYCEQPAMSYSRQGKWLAHSHERPAKRHCECGNPIYELDYLCEVCREMS